MNSNLELDSITFAILFCKSDNKFSKNLIKLADSKYIKYMLEIILNYLVGNLEKVPEEVQKDTHKYKRSFIKLLDKRSSLNSQKKILFKLKPHISQIIVPFLINKIKDE